MTRHAISALALICLISASLRAQPQNIKVSADSVSQYGPEEVSIAVNPADPNQLAIGANDHWLFLSPDGGLTWTSSRIDFGGDPSLAFDNEGYLLYEHLNNQSLALKSYYNGTASDQTHYFGSDGSTFQDKPTLVADRRTNSKTVATAWTRFAKYDSRVPSDSSHILFSTTTDHGLSWSTPIRVDERGGDCIDSSNTVEGAVPAFGPNGEVYIVWSGRDTIFFDHSNDGGQTFAGNRAIAFQPSGWWITENRIFRANGLPVIACDQSSGKYRGRLYVLWTDQRRGVPDVFLIRSMDNGSTWSDPVDLTIDDTAHHLFPAMTIDPTTGHLYVVYYAMQPSGNFATNVYLASSTDGGETFSTRTISTTPFHPGTFLGDYISVAAFDRHVYPAWTRADGSNTSIWTAVISDTTQLAAVRASSDHNMAIGLSNTVGLASISLDNPQEVTVDVIDLMGRTWLSTSQFFSAGTHKIELPASLPHGLYGIRFKTNRQIMSALVLK